MPRLVFKSGKAIERQWTTQTIRPATTSPNLSTSWGTRLERHATSGVRMDVWKAAQRPRRRIDNALPTAAIAMSDVGSGITATGTR